MYHISLHTFHNITPFYVIIYVPNSIKKLFFIFIWNDYK